MKVLYICNEYPPYKHGGIGSFTRDIAEGLASKGHNVTVWGLYNGIKNSIIEKINGVNVYRNTYKSFKSRFQHLHFVYLINYELNQFLKINEFDIIECQEWQGLIPFGLKHPGYIIRLHGASIFFDNLLKRSGNRLMHLLEKRTIKRATNIIAVSEYCGRTTLELVGSKKKYSVIYNAVNKSKLERFKKANYKAHSIVFANSVLPKKGVVELAEAFNIVLQKFPEATLTIIGKLGYKENGINIKDIILSKLNPANISKVNITGWLENSNDVYSYLADAHICCYPSHMEGFGIAPVEAMAIGKPVLFMKNGPGPEVIEDGISGILADGNNSLDIANKIIELFEGKIDGKYIGNNAEQRVQDLFDIDTVFMSKNITYYETLVKR